MKVHLVTGSVFSPSVEVNNFLKIDENQNEEIENDELPDSPVSTTCLVTELVTHVLSKTFKYTYKSSSFHLTFSEVPKVKKFTG